MKKTFLLLAAIAGFNLPAVGQIDLVSLGTATFTVDAGATIASYTQNASGVVFNGTYVLGDTLGGTFTTQDWSNPAYTDFFVVMSLTGTDPNLPFSVSFYDPSFAIINTYSGTTTGATTSTYLPLTLVLPGTGNLSSVVGIQFTWDGGGTINSTVEKIAAVPEPSTYALLALAGAGLLTRRMRRFRRA